MSSSFIKDGTKKSAYDAFNAVDDMVAKPVFGSDGAALWQEFQKGSNNSNSNSATKKKQAPGSVAPKAPLKKVDRAAGFTSWEDERQNEQKVRTETGTQSTGYTHFKRKNNNNNDDNGISAKERKRIEGRIIPEDQDYFISAKTFQGWKWDYIFTTRTEYGTGYYFDGMDSLKKLRGELNGGPPPATNKESSTIHDIAGSAPPVKKKKKKSSKQQGPVIVDDPNNPLEQVAAALQRRQQQQQGVTLPGGWQAATDHGTKKTYYYNAATGERSWEKPIETTTLLPTGWSVAKDNNTGKEYYYNASTGETKWERPT